ncbi:nuclear transport factor 2 family protein [Spirosoma soli]|uniref:Nuclear transport factor 2 family protein n=1 Tax=Spirosoma soli TaxID=1770529 RepID=A0ABW5M1V1_9BACT
MKNLVLSALLTLSVANVFGQNDDVAAVRQACFNYIDTFYKVDTTLAYQSIHPTLQKRGFFFDDKTSAYSKQLEMPFPALIRLAKTWNKDGKRTTSDSPRAVDVFEVADKTATAKVTAVWGIDYIHLIKENDRWMIVNVLWQSAPKLVQAMK